MKVFELSKELNVTNKELIDFLKKNNFKISSHMQPVTDDMISISRENYSSNQVYVAEPVKETTNKSLDNKFENTKIFKPDDVIACRSVTPWKVVALGVDRNTVYHWNGYGDVDYVSYKDLQALRRTEYITQPMIIIEDPDLCYQWRRELGDTYKYFLDVEYPEEFFDKTDEEFNNILQNSPNVIKEVIKVTALNMMRNENYPSVQKLSYIDSILGTCLKEFL